MHWTKGSSGMERVSSPEWILTFVLNTAFFAGMEVAGESVRETEAQDSVLRANGADWGEESVPVGLNKQLFVDDFIVSQWSNLTRELGRVVKENEPIMVPDRPWEDDGFGGYTTVLHDGEKFQMWYPPWSGATAYAESVDRIHWIKPNLGIFDFRLEKVLKLGFQGSGERIDFEGTVNNILGYFGDGFTCFIDSHETDAQHRYKAAYGHPRKFMACLAHSPDGLHWTSYNQGEPVTSRAADTFNHLLWDDLVGQYRLYTRTDFGDDDAREIRGNRAMLNPDIKTDPSNWTTVHSWRFDREGPDEFRRRQIYALADWIYEGVHFGLLWVLEWPVAPPVRGDQIDHYRRHERDVMNVYITPSRDGDNLDLRWVYAQKPLIPRGSDGSFDKDMVMVSSNIVTWKDRHWIYYVGSRERHYREPRRNSIGVATLPLDRFVLLEPWRKEQRGWLITKPFQLQGTRLEVNVDASQGEIFIEVLDEFGRPIPGFTEGQAQILRAVDGLRLRPTWENHDRLAVLCGQTVRLKFGLTKAKLYAFQVNP